MGRSGIELPILAFGCGSVFLKGYPSDEAAVAGLNAALGAGITYFDTAHAYGNGESERRLGMFLRDHRRDVLVATKIPARDADTFMRQFETSLNRLGTDHVDVLHLHSLNDSGDLDAVSGAGGAHRRLMGLREQGAVRLAGFSCHTDGRVARSAIERLDFDCCMLQLNATGAGDFERLALPAALAKGMGVLGMKATAQGRLLAGAPPDRVENLLSYVWGLPVGAVVVGMPGPDILRHNAVLARRYESGRIPTGGLPERLAAERRPLEDYYRTHVDG